MHQSQNYAQGMMAPPPILEERAQSRHQNRPQMVQSANKDKTSQLLKNYEQIIRKEKNGGGGGNSSGQQNLNSSGSNLIKRITNSSTNKSLE